MKEKIAYHIGNTRYLLRLCLPMMLLPYGKLDFLARIILNKESLKKELFDE